MTDAHTPGRPDAGWLLTHVDGAIVAADEASASLLRAGSSDTLIGRNWPSLVTSADRVVAEAALVSGARGEAWSGDLRFVYALEAVPLHVAVTPTGGEPPMLVVRLNSRVFEAARSFEDHRDSAALVVALDAEGALGDDAAAAYAVLQALSRVVRFEWAAVLRFEEASSAQVVGAFPTPMAGVGPGTAWTPLDAAESAIATDGVPHLEVEVGRTPGSASPLERLAAFGLTSRLLIPLFEGASVVGAVACYAPSDAAFRPIDGLRIERFARRLGQRLGQRMAQPPPATASTEDREAEPPLRGNPLADPAAPLDEVVAEVAHQLNNPLTSILGYAQLLPTLPEEDRAAALVTIEQEAERAARMVRDLLTFGREQPSEAATPDPALPRVLVASNDGPLVTLASEVLTRSGYAVDVTPTAEEARSQAGRARYAALVLDAALDPAGQYATVIEAETPMLVGRIVLVVPEGAPAGNRASLTRAGLSAALPAVLANLEEERGRG